MESTRISTKGQVVLPKALREDYGWPAGTDLMIERGPSYVTLRRKGGNGARRPTAIEDVIGMFKVDRPVSDEEIDRAIDEGYRRRWHRKR